SASEEKYDFIREFARYDIGDYPVFYFPRNVPFILLQEKEAKQPQFLLDKRFKYFIHDYGFYEIEFLSHLFAFPIKRNYEIGLEIYLKESIKQKGKYYKKPILLEYLTEIDLILAVLND
ncbi:MAG: hypothetical protein JW798_06305, partial [Prolixibacteraceae bacterium]|nr:hypothetical protein [Prolixibacteraceae bacterium]